MKKKRVLIIVLTACLLATMIPAVTLLARSESKADPVYNRVKTPEVAIFNAYTGASMDFFMLQQSLCSQPAPWNLSELRHTALCQPLYARL